MPWIAIVAALLCMGGCASLPENVDRRESHALQDTEMTRLGRSAQAALRLHPGESGFLPLVTGVDALLARIHLADAAERTLDVQYYIWRDDLTGRLFAAALLRAADRDVRVRILVDDVGTSANDATLLRLEAHANVEIRLFNPVASRRFRGMGMLTEFSRVNRRMHNKALVADNQHAIVGGRNIGDEYFEANSEMAFRDLDVLTVGPVVDQVSRAFDRYWNAPLSIPITALTGRHADAPGLEALRADLAEFVEAQRDSPYVIGARAVRAQVLDVDAESFYWGKGHLVVDDPAKVTRTREDTEGHLLPQLRALGLPLRTELLIVSPYFVPGDAGVVWLRGLVREGLRVTVLTNSLAANDVPAVHSGYRRYREALLEAGVRLYELKPGAIAYGHDKHANRHISGSQASLHAKTFVFDRRAVFIGSLNLDPRSLQLNTEIGVVCESERLAQTLVSGIEAALDTVAWRLERVTGSDGKAKLVWIEPTDQGPRQRLDEPEAGAWRKLRVWLLGLLPIEPQL